jgi:hypothetical protein
VNSWHSVATDVRGNNPRHQLHPPSSVVACAEHVGKSEHNVAKVGVRRRRALNLTLRHKFACVKNQSHVKSVMY